MTSCVDSLAPRHVVLKLRWSYAQMVLCSTRTLHANKQKCPTTRTATSRADSSAPRLASRSCCRSSAIAASACSSKTTKGLWKAQHVVSHAALGQLQFDLQRSGWPPATPARANRPTYLPGAVSLLAVDEAKC